MSKYIATYKQFPKQIFRLSPDRSVKLRPYQPGKNSYDVVVGADNIVKAKWVDQAKYSAPNGASMRPQGTKQSELVQSFKGSSVCVYEVPAGTKLPSDLILVHENSDHYSLQPAVEMKLSDLNTKITSFLQAYGKVYTRDEWIQKYDPPRPSSSGSATASVKWIQDPKSKKYYYIDPKTKKPVWKK